MLRLSENVCWKRPDLWKDNSWILLHDKAPSHKAHILNAFLTENSKNIIGQRDIDRLYPCDYFISTKLKLLLRGRRLESIEPTKFTYAIQERFDVNWTTSELDNF